MMVQFFFCIEMASAAKKIQTLKWRLVNYPSHFLVEVVPFFEDMLPCYPRGN